MRTAGRPGTDFDALVVGAGFSGLYMLRRLRGLGLSARVYEAGDDVGGTWYWNRYPGARCDSESVYYSFSDRFSEKLLQEWTWSERFAAQPEILRYLQHVADTFDLRRDIRFNTAVTEAIYDEENHRWEVDTSDGDRVSVRFLITAVGCLSSANLPSFPGLETFQGDWYHTGTWPHSGVDFTERRVGVIGTGATGVQLIPEVAEQAAHLWVFQRTPNYDVAGRNGPLDPEYVRNIKANYRQIWRKARESGQGFPYENPGGSALAATPEERLRRYEMAWERGGFRLVRSFGDFLVNAESNETVSEFVRSKIREAVRDPKVAELLTPRDHPFSTKRTPLENGYYEAFNRDNVTLVDVRRAPIEEITSNGLRTSEAEYEFDSLVFATGFDAMTGALLKIGIRGRAGVALRDKWAAGPRTYLGLTTHGFPNLFLITGPQSPSVLSNMVVSIEQHVEWIAKCLDYLCARNIDSIEALASAEADWVDHHNEVAAATLLLKTNSWWVGANIPGKLRTLYPYAGGVGNYRNICDQVAAKGYEGFALSRATVGY